MRINKITREVFVEIDGKEYALLLNISGLEQLEKTTGNIMQMLNNEPLPSLTAITTAFWIGLGGAKKMTRGEASNLLEKYMVIHGTGGGHADNEGAVTMFYAMIAASGLLGKKDSDKMLRSFGLVDGEETGEGKNEMTAEEN